MKKLAAIAAAVGLALFSLTGCAQSGVKTSAEATPENPMVLTLAHGPVSYTHLDVYKRQFLQLFIVPNLLYNGHRKNPREHHNTKENHPWRCV